MNDQEKISVIGIDLGGTKIRASSIHGSLILESSQLKVPSKGSVADVIRVICQSIDKVLQPDVVGIGVGVPSIVDIEKGIVYDVQNIPSWKEVYLKDILEQKYSLPVFLNNDANCFALGEKYFGKGQGYENLAGLIIGTGLAAGMILNGKIYNGVNCGAGEFGMVHYLDHHFEYYASGQFFENVHSVSGVTLHQEAIEGNSKALQIFEEYGMHLGRAINMVLYSYDPEVIILGGSVSKSYHFFKSAMWGEINKLVYRSVIENIKIEISTDVNIPVLGAAALYYDAKVDNWKSERNKKAIVN